MKPSCKIWSLASFVPKIPMSSSSSASTNSGPYAYSSKISTFVISVPSFLAKLSLFKELASPNYFPLTRLTTAKSEMANGCKPWSFSPFPENTGDDSPFDKITWKAPKLLYPVAFLCFKSVILVGMFFAIYSRSLANGHSILTSVS